MFTVFGRWSVTRHVSCSMLAQNELHARSNAAMSACLAGPGAKLTSAKLYPATPVAAFASGASTAAVVSAPSPASVGVKLPWPK